MTAPDWVTAVPSSDSIHTIPGMESGIILPPQVNLLELGAKFVEMILQKVIEAIFGLFSPDLGGAFDQFADWASDVPGIGALVQALTGQSGGLELLAPLSGFFPALDELAGLAVPFIESLFLDNGDGTATFITDQIHNLIDMGDGVAMSLNEVFSNLTGVLGTFTAIADRLQGLIDAIFNALSSAGSILGNPVGVVEDVLQNIPFFNILGNLGLTNIGDTTQSIVDQFISGFVDSIGFGASLADAFGVANTIGSQSFLGKLANDFLGIRNNTPMYTGMLDTSDSTVPLHQVAGGGSAVTTAVTQSNTILGFKRFQQPMSVGALSWLGSGLTSVDLFFVNIHQMVTGDKMTKVYQSPDVKANVSATMAYATVTIDPPLEVEATDVIAVELIPYGSGTHNVVTQTTWIPAHPTVIPGLPAARCNRTNGLFQPSIWNGAPYWDNFDALDGSSGSSLNNGWTNSGGCTATGALHVPAANEFLQSLDLFDFSGHEVFTECVQVTPGAATTQFRVYSEADPNDFLRIYQNGGNLFFDHQINSVVNQTSVAYNNTTHRWWRMSENGGVGRFETSPDGWAWTTQRTVTLGAIDLSAVRLEYFAGTGTGEAIFDRLNLVHVPNIPLTNSTPFIEIAVQAASTSGAQYHSPEVRNFDSSATYIVESWVNTIEAVPLGAGGGAWRGAFGFNGQGGNAGTFNTRTFNRGTHFNTGDAVTITVGNGGFGIASGGGGNAGTGGTTTISVNGNSISASGGTGGTGSATSAAQVPGDGAGSINYNGQNYTGGGQQNQQGGTGIAPGGGGGGGAQPNGSGGAGGKGRGWLKLIQ